MIVGVEEGAEITAAEHLARRRRAPWVMAGSVCLVALTAVAGIALLMHGYMVVALAACVPLTAIAMGAAKTFADAHQIRREIATLPPARLL
jgi:hypothetical protein